MKAILVFSFIIVAATAKSNLTMSWWFSRVCLGKILDKEFVEEFMEKMLKIGEICSKEVGATTEDISELMAHTVPAAHTGKCMIFCFHKHFNVQKEDGSVDKEGAIKSLDPLKAADADLYEKVVEVFTLCGNKVVPDNDPCITAANLAQCAMDEGKANTEVATQIFC